MLSHKLNNLKINLFQATKTLPGGWFQAKRESTSKNRGAKCGLEGLKVPQKGLLKPEIKL